MTSLATQIWRIIALKNNKRRGAEVCTVKAHIWLLMVAGLLFSFATARLGLEAARFGDRKYQTCFIFTIQDRGGIDWIGNSKIIVLIPKTWYLDK